MAGEGTVQNVPVSEFHWGMWICLVLWECSNKEVHHEPRREDDQDGHLDDRWGGCSSRWQCLLLVNFLGRPFR